MAVNHFRFYSEALGKYSCAHIILPLTRHGGVPRAPLPTLTLLHGMGDDESAWLRKTGVERYALEHGLAVVMPEGGLSCYENMVHGANYRDFIADELPRITRACFPLSAAREENFIAGCSMGGCGALKLALAEPEKWAAAGSFSGAHLEYRAVSPRIARILEQIYGDNLDARDAQIERDALRIHEPRLRLWQGCGEQDSLKDAVLASRDFLQRVPGIDYHFEMIPGRHDWALWDELLRRFLRTLPLPEPEVTLL